MEILPGAWDTGSYIPLLTGKRVGLVVNHTSTIGHTHLVDSLVKLGLDIHALYSPEHGLRGQADAGSHIKSEIDSITGIKVISLYGDKKKPTAANLEGIEILVFDIQDVGVRFYTYISTLHYIMEVAAEVGIPVMVLDRPNPNGHYVDGPMLDTSSYRTFVGMHPIPVVYGMTMGELAQMINGEKWIKKPCELTVIPCLNYSHSMMYDLPVKPSPNLPNLRSILLYPGICFFEGTILSLGRGTATPFQIVGHPDYPDHSFSFTPVATSGASNPPLKNKLCYGLDLSHLKADSLFQTRELNMSILMHFYKTMHTNRFFNYDWFDKLAGSPSFRKSIEAGWSEEKIRENWLMDSEEFRQRRKRYLLYPDFR